MTIGDTLATQWVATAPFLAEPYRGSDAYITKDGFMQAMVTTFDGGALKMKKEVLIRRAVDGGASVFKIALWRELTPEDATVTNSGVLEPVEGLG